MVGRFNTRKFFEGIPLTKEPQYSYYFKNPKNRKQNFYDPDVTWKFSPEQYFTTTFFGKFFEQANMQSLQDVKPEQIELSQRIFASNVVVCGYKECGAYIQKQEYKFVSININWLKGVWLSGVYRYADFLADYKKYCDKGNIFYKTSRVSNNFIDFKNENILATELGAINKYSSDNNVVSDYFLNAANINSVDLLRKCGVKTVTLSVENNIIPPNKI